MVVFSEIESMDIKNALNAILPLQLRAKTAADRTIKSSNTTDRDANGQTGYHQDQNQSHREPMTDEQLQKAMQTLMDFPAIKDNQLSVELVEINGKKFVLLKEPDGNVLRRIPEVELWTLPSMSETDPDKKGQLLRKMA